MDAYAKMFLGELENGRDDCLSAISEAIIDRDYNRIFEQSGRLKVIIENIQTLVEREGAVR